MAASLKPSLPFIHGVKKPKTPLTPLHVHHLHPQSQPWLQCTPIIRIPTPLMSKHPSRLACTGASANHIEQPNTQPPISPISTMIHSFYNSINSKTIADEELAKFISKECKFEDMAFQKPFIGEKEVNDFLRELKKAMGKQIKFKVDKVFGGNGLDVGVLWHLEWNENVIPFTKGCSLFECSRAGENILINEAKIFEETLLKPGKIAIELLKLVSTCFDKYPKSAERFLKKFDEIIKWFMKVYRQVMFWIIAPFLKYQTQLWGCALKIIALVGGILLNLLKFIGLI